MSTSLFMNYRNRKDTYVKTDELFIYVRYYSSGIKEGKLFNISTGIKIKIKDWNTNWSKTRKREPVKKSDRDYKTKNQLIKHKESEVENIVKQLKLNNQIPTVELVKSHLRKEHIKKRKETITESHFLIMLDRFRESVNSQNNQNSDNTKRSLKSSLKDIEEYSQNYEGKHQTKLWVNDIDEKWMWGYINDCDKRGHQPTTIKKRLKVISQFGKWCSKEFNTTHEISIPSNFKVKSEKEIIFLTREEVFKLIEFDEFNFSNPKHKKHLKKNQQGCEYISDTTTTKSKNFERKYTSYQVYKDMLLFLCGTGMRFGDMVKLRVQDHSKKSFSFMMEKTNKNVKIPVDSYVTKIWMDYSSSKKQNSYLFPTTKFKNPISNQKFNKHIKEVCKIVGLFRKVKKPKFNIHGKVVPGTDEKYLLYNSISSHIGRRTFIREHIELGTPPRKIMKMTGHTSQKVFDGYYDILDGDMEGVNKNIFEKQSSPKVHKSESGNLTSEQIEKKLKELKLRNDQKLLPDEVYHDLIKDLYK